MTDLAAYIRVISTRILGQPNRALSTRDELRFGTNGSVSVLVDGDRAGSWFDFELSVGGGPRELIEIKGGVADDDVDPWLEREFGIRKPNGRGGSHFNIVATYAYRDESGELLFQVCRLAPKSFRQRRPDGKGGWIWSTKGVRRVLYRLPDLIAAPLAEWVFVCEGEKDCDCLARLGLVATTNPGGAAKHRPDGKAGRSSWRPEFNQFFAGRRVCVLRDNDEAGRDHAQTIVRNLVPIADCVVAPELPGLPPKGDVSDWLDAGGTREQLLELAAIAAPQPGPDPGPQLPDPDPFVAEISRLACLSPVEFDRERRPAAKRLGVRLETLDSEVAAERRNIVDKDAAASSELAKTIERFNQHYAVVNEDGFAVIYQRVEDPILKREKLVSISFADFKKFYQNEPITVMTSIGPVTKPAPEWWLDSPHRRQYLGGVVFDPIGKAPKDCWNLWGGFAVKPAPGDWSLMRTHIEKVICAGQDALSNYFLSWLARLFQEPNKPAEVAIVFRGDLGTGKGIVCKWLIRALGRHALHITNARHLVGNFNDHLRDCLLLHVDEAYFAGDKQHEGVLKGLITEPTLPIEPKFRRLIQVLNMLHIIMSSNSDWVVPAALRERRFCVTDVADTHIKDHAYFRKIDEQMEQGGLAAMVHDLLQRDISGFNHRAVPDSHALAEQKLLTLDSLHKWWLTVLERGFIWKSRHGADVFKDWPEFCATELLWGSYLQWCGETRPYDRKSRVELGKMMTKMYPATKPGVGQEFPIYEVDVMPAGTMDLAVYADRPHGYTLGSLTEARVQFSNVTNVVGEWGLDP